MDKFQSGAEFEIHVLQIKGKALVSTKCLFSVIVFAINIYTLPQSSVLNTVSNKMNLAV